MLIMLTTVLALTCWFIPVFAHLAGTYTNDYIVYWLVLLLLLEISYDYKFQNLVFKNRVQRKLKSLDEIGYVLSDIFIKLRDNWIQIDHILINKYGIFIIEDREYFGEIFGNMDDDELRYIDKERQNEYIIANPIKKNELTKSILTKLIKDKSIPIHTVVVFNNDVSLKLSHPDIMYLKDLDNILKIYGEETIPDEKLGQLYDCIKSSDIKNKIPSTKRRKGKYICPICGSELEKYVDKKGVMYLRCKRSSRCSYKRKI